MVTPLDLQAPGQHVDGALAGVVVVGPRLGARRHAEDAHVDVRGPGRRLRDLVAADDAPRGVAVLALCLDDLHGAPDYCQADLNRARPSAISAGAWVVKENRSVARSGSPAKNG